jgi:hypothetical protein
VIEEDSFSAEFWIPAYPCFSSNPFFGDQHRVKPCPDPTRPENDTNWMTLSQIEDETMKPSYEYIEAGSGSLGKIMLEILKCDDLPNKDKKLPGSMDMGLTDAFAAIVFEDAVVNTDVIRK